MVAKVGRYDDFKLKIGRWLVTAWAGLQASFGEPGPLEKKRANVTRSGDQETTNRYNENDGVSTLASVHDSELVFGSPASSVLINLNQIKPMVDFKFQAVVVVAQCRTKLT